MKKLHISLLLLTTLSLIDTSVFAATEESRWLRMIDQMAPSYIENMPEMIKDIKKHKAGRSNKGYNSFGLACVLCSMSMYYKDMFGSWIRDGSNVLYSKKRQAAYEVIIKHFMKHGCNISEKFDIAEFTGSPNVSYHNVPKQSIMAIAVSMDIAMISALFKNGLSLNKNDQLDILLFLTGTGCDLLPVNSQYESDYTTLKIFFNTCDISVQQEFLEKNPELQKIFTK